ncbi:MAG: 50S ribosomal protein L23 [Bacilli bacterium]|jgi:large subunit ribosomal protein L23|nr:50S ribosomal protein L23 [Bacilli bacterium]
MAEEEKKETAVETEKKPVKKAAATKAAPKKEAAAPKKAPAKKASASKKAEEVKPAEVKAEPKEEKKEEAKKPAMKEFKTRKPTQHDFEIIHGPYITEKTQAMEAKENKIVLRVASSATATEIKEAVQAIFGVKVDKVNTVNVRAKAKRMGRYEGHVPGFKKAIVKVNKDYDLGEIAKAAQAEQAK